MISRASRAGFISVGQAVQRLVADAKHAGVLGFVAVRRRVALEVVMQVADTCHAQTTSKRAIIAWSSCSMLWQ